MVTAPSVPVVSDVYIVLSEEEYGGSDKIKVFYRHSDAENYIEDGGIIIRQEILSPWSKVFVVVFETFFGGDVKCFTTRDRADEYLLVKGNEHNLDGEVIETSVLLAQ
ncbi:MAG: hypothetical protein PHG66_04790 [Candidatus Colwellbacteria bacterium]|nr:hypothetical protein [Candidatus Colwellbacteria bacterium]